VCVSVCVSVAHSFELFCWLFTDSDISIRLVILFLTRPLLKM